MNGTELKSFQRKQGVAGRKGIPAELRDSSNKLITEKIIGLKAYQKANTILSYQPFGGEVDTGLLNLAAAAAGKQVAYPISEPGGLLIPAIPDRADSWAVGKFGIRAPIKDNSLIISPLEIDLVIVPCTAFCAKSLKRIGMGAGYYDRFLPKCINAAAVAVAFEVQNISDLWADPWDIPLDAVVTETAVYGKIN